MPLGAETVASPEGSVVSQYLLKPLRVRNNEPNMTVFTKVVNGESLRITLATKGQPGDTVRMPLAIVQDIDFLNALDQGCIEVIDGPPEIVAALKSEQAVLRDERLANERRALEGVIDRSQREDLIGMSCIGPNPNPGRQGLCGAALIQKAAQTGTVPPLCATHTHLAPTFSLIEVGSKGDEENGASQSSAGIVRKEWRQAVISPTLLPSQ